MNTIQTDPQEQLRSSMEQLLAAMCHEPKHCTVRLVPSARKPLLVVSVSRCDYGAVLGKGQSMLNALKYLTNCLARRLSFIEGNLELDQDEVIESSKQRPKCVDEPNWQQDELAKLASTFCCDLMGVCHVTIEPVTKSQVKMTVTAGSETPERLNVNDFESALSLVFNCVAVLQGKRVVVEVVA